VNRGNLRARIFHQAADYRGFLGAMAAAAEQTVVRVVVFNLMPNHFHLVLWPHAGSEISAYMQVLMNAHIRDIQRRHNTRGTGHIYQARFRPHPILTARQFYNVCAYVERNALTAGLVSRAEDWPWCSLTTRGPARGIDLLSDWPLRRPKRWLDIVNAPRTAASEYPLAEGFVPKVPATKRRSR
jgi:putative transposase